MAARKPARSQQGARALAKERLAARVAAAERTLGTFLDAAESEERLRGELERARTEKEAALREMVRLVGMAAAVEMSGLSERSVRSAVASGRPRRASATTTPTTRRSRRQAAAAGAPADPADEAGGTVEPSETGGESAA